MIWRTMAERTYPPHAVPWEAEAGWAGRTENMTQKALDSVLVALCGVIMIQHL